VTKWTPLTARLHDCYLYERCVQSITNSHDYGKILCHVTAGYADQYSLLCELSPATTHDPLQDNGTSRQLSQLTAWRGYKQYVRTRDCSCSGLWWLRIDLTCTGMNEYSFWFHPFCLPRFLACYLFHAPQTICHRYRECRKYMHLHILTNHIIEHQCAFNHYCRL
jgi:hypothetical protein